MRRLRRWIINGLTTLSLLLLAATCVMWMRSEWVAERFYFAPQPAASFPNLDGVLVPAQQSRWIGSTAGRMSIGATTATDAGSTRGEEMSRPAGHRHYEYAAGYLRGISGPTGRPPTLPGYSVTGVRAIAFPGFLWFDQPAQFVAAPNPPMAAPGGGGGVLGGAFFPGERSLSVAYWPLALLFAFPPATRLFLHRRRLRKSRLVGLCSRCGYDLRASPERCPECGLAKPLAV